jgi:hypothetical protein
MSETTCPPPPYKEGYEKFIGMIHNKYKHTRSRSTTDAKSLSVKSLPTKPSRTPQKTKSQSPGTCISSQSLASRSRKPQSASF